MKRIASISIGLFGLAIIGVMFASGAHGQNKIYVGWFNDANRTFAGHGCWTGPGEYRTCDYWDPPITGWWGTGEAWLWIYAEDPGIQDFSIVPAFGGGGEYNPHPCQEESIYPNREIMMGDPNFHLVQEPEAWEATFHECQIGWFWVAHVSLWRRGSWSFDLLYHRTATLCDESHTQKEMIAFSHYVLNPVPPDQCEGGSVIATESTTWGSIKALYK